MNALAPITALAAASALADRAALTRAAEIVALVVEPRNTYPILANVRLRGDGRTLFLTATNLDMMIDVALPAAADTGLDFTIPARTLKDLLKGAPKAADMVSLTMPPATVKRVPTGKNVTDPETGIEAVDPETDEPVKEFEDRIEYSGAFTVDFEAVKYQLTGLPSDNFPDLKGPRKEWRDEKGNLFRAKSYRAFELSGADLFAALDAVEFAISSEETRYYLNGVYLHVVTPSGANRPELRFVATDGHRMARQEVTAPDGALDMPGIILPKSLVYLLLKLLKPAKGKALPDVAIELTDSAIRFMFDDVTVTSKLIDGTFPDYERVTPKNNEKLATFGVAAVLEAIKAVSMIASERGGKAVKIILESGICTLSVNNPDHGTAESSFPITQEFDGPFEIGFNAKYLTDMVTEAKADGDAVTMAFNDAASPTVITGSRDGWLGVLMPMRV